MAHNPFGKAAVQLGTMGGLVTFAGPDSLASGASPRNHDVEFDVGSVLSRRGLKPVYSFSGNTSTQPGGAAASAIWANPNGAFDTVTQATAFGPSVGTLTVTQFAFNVSQSVTGITVNLNGTCNTAGTITAQLTQGGVLIGNPKSANCPVASFGGPLDMWGASPNVDDTTFGVVFTASSAFPLVAYAINAVSITLSLAASSVNFQYVKSFQLANGTLKTLAIDANGQWWVEDVTGNPGVLKSLLTGLPAGTYANSITANDREYLCFNNLFTGSDIPRQYTGEWIDRITQVGPAAAPAFTPQVASGNAYPIATITQPTAQSRGYSYFLQSAGPGSSTAGNVVTFYYADSTGSGPDADLVAAINSGFPVYVYASFTGTPVPFGPSVVQVLSVGLASPPGQPRQFYYFTFNVPTVAYTYYQGSGHASYTANYQRTLAAMTTNSPVPGLAVGSRATITGSSIASYNSTWLISQTLNSGAMVITQTVVSAGVATYSYSLSSGVAPVVGNTVTISGTTNANGALNVTNTTIASATGGSSGTFSVNVSAADTPAAAESGQATTAGTQFDFDPGAALLGTSSNPIFGNASGGSVIFAGTAKYISPGVRQGVVFFGTRNSAETAPSPPVIFTIPTNTSTLVASQIPIGPPNTSYRQIAVTQPGQNGLPGGDFYTIDTPVNYTINGVSYTSTSFRIPNNVDTSVSLTFRDSDLLAARRIDVQGQDLFNQIEVSNPSWVKSYAGRMFYGLSQNKVPNFLNMSFDGGYILGNPFPLGWQNIPSLASGQLNVSAIFGNSYYVKNTSATTGQIGTIQQSAYQDAYNVAILRPNVTYSVRIAARIPSGNTTGNIVVALLDANGLVYGRATFKFSAFTGIFSTQSATLLATALSPVPPTLTMCVYGDSVAPGADFEIDRIEVYPTRQPVNTTRILASYVANPEGVDGVTGAIGTSGENTQPCYGAAVMYDLLYLLKDQSLYYTQDSASEEPSQWGVHEVSNRAGACGVNAYDSGEEWILMANRNGVYLFTGGEPRKISQEIQSVWDSINWAAGKSIWVRNDVQERIFYIGVPMATPNAFLPSAPVNAAPSYPNVILVCNYQGQATGSEIADAHPLASSFYGDLLAEEMRRKWTIWQVAAPYAEFIKQQNLKDAPLYLCNGIANSKIYTLGGTNDDGAEIPWRYATYGFGADKDTRNNPALGNGRKRWSYLLATMSGSGNAACTLYSNKLDSPTAYTVPGGIALTADEFDRERPLNIPGNRVFVEFRSGGLNSQMALSALTMFGTKDVFNAIRGSE